MIASKVVIVFYVVFLTMILCGCVGSTEAWEAKDLAKEAIRGMERLQERIENLEEKVYITEYS